MCKRFNFAAKMNKMNAACVQDSPGSPEKGDADFYIEKLNLQPHPEGGYYRETFSGMDVIRVEGLPQRYKGARKTFTVIYYLLNREQVSLFHRLKSDEIFTFYAGSPLILHLIDESGHYFQQILGFDVTDEISMQRVVKCGTWFGASVFDIKSFSLVGCIVAPGFEFEDFEIGKRDELLARYPQHAAIIQKLTLELK